MSSLTLDQIETHVATQHLAVMGCVANDLPGDIGTVVLLGPKEPGFWAGFTTSPEYQDGSADPVDRWSLRVIGELATDLGGRAYFPFTGPPYQPFLRWARDSGRAHISPVGPLVHDTAGLMISYRGAIGFNGKIPFPAPGPTPCDTCAPKPCLTACPVDAFAGPDYDVTACKADLDRPGNDCMTRGCAVRRACPVSQSYGRLDAQSAHHMDYFR